MDDTRLGRLDAKLPSEPISRLLLHCPHALLTSESAPVAQPMLADPLLALGVTFSEEPEAQTRRATEAFCTFADAGLRQM